jgi:hypothetical protein
LPDAAALGVLYINREAKVCTIPSQTHDALAQSAPSHTCDSAQCPYSDPGVYPALMDAPSANLLL